MGGCVHDYMCNEILARRGERLNNTILDRYIGGQVMVSRTLGKKVHNIVGQIETISIAGIVVEVSCDWIAYQKPYGLIWRKDDTHSENLIDIEMTHGWVGLSDGGIEIPTLHGFAILTPKNFKGFQIDPSKIVGLG